MKRYIVTLDQSTSASKVFLLDDQGAIIRRFSKAHEQFYPAPGHVEHDAEEIFRNVVEGINTVLKDIPTEEVGAISISNQRETTVIWDRETGEPVCHALVWQDVRGEYITEELKEHRQTVLERTGLALSPYYPAAKAAAVFRERPDLLKRAEAGELCFGTIDSYLIYRFTNGALHATDVSNAGRTQLFRLDQLAWDAELAALFGIPVCALPTKILHSDADFGCTAHPSLPKGIRITGVMGDSHAALYGNGCHQPGTAKATYGTGSSVMLNVGEKPILSRNGLSACVGFGWQGKVCYVLEGNVTCSGDTLVWLKENMGMISDISEVEPLAASVPDTGGVSLIPAFSGLGAPYFDSDALAVICGMNRGTTRAHVVRAALESIAQQDADVLEAMSKDFGSPVTQIFADGGPSSNKLLMQLQADLVPCKVNCAALSELSALGSGYMGGIASGVYPSFEEIPQRKQPGRVYEPVMSEEKRNALRDIWKNAVKTVSSR